MEDRPKALTAGGQYFKANTLIVFYCSVCVYSQRVRASRLVCLDSLPPTGEGEPSRTPGRAAGRRMDEGVLQKTVNNAKIKIACG